MALNAKGIPACFLGSAQLSAQVKEDAWRGGAKGRWHNNGGCFCWSGVGLPACLMSHPPACLLMQLQFALATTTLPLSRCPADLARLPCTPHPSLCAGKYRFVYITPELAAVSIERLRALKNSAVSNPGRGGGRPSIVRGWRRPWQQLSWCVGLRRLAARGPQAGREGTWQDARVSTCLLA